MCDYQHPCKYGHFDCSNTERGDCSHEQWCNNVCSAERAIAAAVVKAALDRDYAISVLDGEDVTVERSRNPETILRAMRTTDEDYLLIHRRIGSGPNGNEHSSMFNADHFGWVRFVYGNSGFDVICDNTTNLETMLAGDVEKTITKWEKRIDG